MAVLGSLKALGLTTTLSYAAARAVANRGRIAYHRYCIVAVPGSGMPAMPRGLDVRPVAAAELKTFVIDATLSVQQARFDQGLACLGAFEAGDLVGVNWLTRGHFDEDEVHVRYVLPDDAAWDTGLWIRPDRRLSRAFAALWAGSAAWLAAHGLERSLSRIADYNLASLNSHRRMNGRTLGTMTVLRVGGTQIATQAKPHVTRGGRAVLDLRHWR